MPAPLSYRVDLEKSSGVDAVAAGLGNVAQKVEGADSEIKKLQSHLNALKAPGEVARLKKEISDFGKPAVDHFKGVGAAIEETSGHLHHFMEFVGAGLAVEGLKKAAEVAMDLGREIVGAAAGAERLNLSFKLTLGDEEGERILGWIDKIQSKTEFTGDQLKAWTLQLANAGVKASELDKFLAAGLDVAGKRGPAAMEMAIDALGRANLTGNIEGHVLRGLGIPVAQLGQLPQFQGLNEKQINKKLETTQIKRDDLLALIAGPDKMLGDIGIQAGDTLAAKLKNLKSLPDEFFSKFAESSSFDVIKSRLDDLFSALDPNGPSGKAIFDSLDTVLGTVVEKVKTIDFKQVAQSVVGVVDALQRMFSVVVGIVDKVSALTSNSAIGAVLKQVTEQNQVDDAKAAILDGRPIPDNDVTRRLGLVKEDPAAQAAGESAALAYAKGMLGGIDFVTMASSVMGQSSIDSLNKTLERHSPPAVFVRAGQDIPKAIALGIEDEGPAVETAMRSALTLPSGLGGAEGGGAGGSSGLPGMAGITIEMPISIQIGSGADRQQGEQAGRAAADVIEERLLALLERLGMGMGAAA